MKSTIGRPRKLTDRQVKVILAWHARYLGWRALRATLKSQRQLASELGVSQATICHVVRHRGEYKQVCPALRARRVKWRQA
jgi:transposase